MAAVDDLPEFYSTPFMEEHQYWFSTLETGVIFPLVPVYSGYDTFYSPRASCLLESSFQSTMLQASGIYPFPAPLDHTYCFSTVEGFECTCSAILESGSGTGSSELVV